MNRDDTTLGKTEFSNAELVNQDSFERLRSKNHRKEIGRRIFYFFLALLLTVVLGLLCIAFFFGLRSFEVKGSSRYTKEEILTASGFDTTDNLFGLDFKAAEKAILAHCPYISEVTFKRVLPSTLVITVVEDAPSYYAEIYGAWFLLSEDLRVISFHSMKEDIEVLDLPVVRLSVPAVDRAVVGEPLIFTKPADYRYLLSFLSDLREQPMFEDVDYVDASDRYHINLYANDGHFKILVGNADNLETKLRFVQKVINDAFHPYAIASINVEYVNQVIVLEQDNLFTY